MREVLQNKDILSDKRHNLSETSLEQLIVVNNNKILVIGNWLTENENSNLNHSLILALYLIV